MINDEKKFNHVSGFCVRGCVRKVTFVRRSAFGIRSLPRITFLKFIPPTGEKYAEGVKSLRWQVEKCLRCRIIVRRVAGGAFYSRTYIVVHTCIVVLIDARTYRARKRPIRSAG